jgi:hypothetical protein
MSPKWTLSFWSYNLNNTGWYLGSNWSGYVYNFSSTLRTWILILSNGNQVSRQLLSTSMPSLNNWTHIVIKYDTTLTTPEDRYICYYNNVRQLNNGAYGASGSNLELNDVPYEFANPTQFFIGNNQYNGYLSQYIFVDNQALTPDNFGYQINNTWIAKPYTGTFGPHGWYLDFSNSSNIGLDISGNNNNWTVNNLTSSNIVSNNICPQLYYKNTNIIITNGNSIPYNVYNITYTLKYNQNQIITANRTIKIMNYTPLLGAYNIRNQYMYTYNTTITNNLNLLKNLTGWTIEFYLKLIDNNGLNIVVLGNSATAYPFQITCAGSTNLYVYSGYYGFARPNDSLIINKWYHIAIQRNNNNIEFLYDGSLVFTQTFNFESTIQNIDRLIIGAHSYFGQLGNHNIAQLKISTIRRYASSFTPSTNLYIDGFDNCIFALGNDYDDLITNTLLSYNSKPFFDTNAFY